MLNQKGKIKCVVWDLDDTLWDGTLLEGGSLGLKPGVRDVLQTLDERGILQSIASKNDRAHALGKLKELGIDHYFLYPQIGWNAKSIKVTAVRDHLNIGMDSILFIDDQPFERDEVSSVHAEVLTLDAADYRCLLTLPCVKPVFVTDDSKNRRQRYLEDLRRASDEERYCGPKDEFLSGLDMRLTISLATVVDLQRAEELTIRTNQLNSTGVTYSYDELRRYLARGDHRLLICELTDCYGSYGKIGLALLELGDAHWHVKLLLMSCRVMSRGLGTVLLHYIMHECQRAGCTLTADFRSTGKNRMMEISYRLGNFRPLSEHAEGFIVFASDLSVVPALPPYLKISAPMLAASPADVDA